MQHFEYSNISLKRPVEQGRWLQRVSPLLLSALVVLFVGGGFYWLQWASQRGITLGYPKPSVNMTLAPSSTILINTTTVFAAAANGRELTYTWDFGDGTGDSGPSVSHNFQKNGSFTVTVEVNDPIGQASTTTTTVSVAPPAPQAVFTYNYSDYGGYVYFDASNSSADPSTAIAAFSWDFGDGNTDPNGYAREGHQYYYVGNYQVTLVVTDQTGQRSNPYTITVVIS